ncbi:MAG: ABC transporter permease [Burkholderiales bacterium]|nr:ABC transporter permease [Burkholderiales bacterium]
MARPINLVRLRSIIRKEFRQMIRDRSTLIIGILLPIILLILFGYGMSFDVMHQSVIVVKEKPSPLADEIFMAMKLTPYFTPKWAASWPEAEKEFIDGKADGIVRIEQSSSATAGNVQVIVNGIDANTARLMESYIQGAVSGVYTKTLSGEGFKGDPSSIGGAQAISRVWYNSAAESRYFLVPGVIVLILSIVGSMLTAMMIAREWERGTYEALISTDISRIEIFIAKVVPTFCLGFIGLLICLFTGYFIFGVPLRGNLGLVLLASSLYLLVCLCLGLTISAIVKSQFLASQIVLVFAFLPTLMLSGYLFDLKSAPVWANVIANFFPATWFVELLISLYLVGNVPFLIERNMAMLALYVLVLGLAATKNIKKSLE